MTDDPHRQPQPSGNEPTANTPQTAGPHASGANDSPVLVQDFDTGSLFALRAAVAAHATDAGASESRARNIVLAVHELAVNAIRHGAGHGRLVISDRDGVLHCQVTDAGNPPAARPDTGVERKTTSHEDVRWPSERGHGLWFVRQIADHVSVQSGPGGTVASASFALPPPSQQRPGPR